MSYARSHFESFGDHTLLKHSILRSYLLQWACILLSDKARNRDVVFIDCFAGPGHDKDGNEGSPLIATAVQRTVQLMAQQGALTGDSVFRFAAVEKDKDLFAEMRQSVAAVAPIDPAVMFLRKGDYRDYLGDLSLFRGESPCLTFLDPYGVSGLEASAFPKLLAGPRSELLILVSGIGAARLHGVLAADGHEFDAELEALHDAPMLFPEMQEEHESRVRMDRDEYIEALDATKPKAREALLRALGGEQAVEELQKLPRSQRPNAFVRAIADLLRQAGATHIVSIPMRDEKGTLKYTLLHASKAERAVSAMKKAVSDGLKRDDLAASVRDRIRNDLSLPLQWYADRLAELYPGTGEYWAWGRKQRGKRSFQEILLETTPLFSFQLQDLKKVLRDRGLLRKHNDREWVEFP